jgi:trans-aconitate methyltransferase
MSTQIWNSQDYATHGRFVATFGKGLLKLLDAKPGERILDVGCGDGVLTKDIADLGCSVVGLDSSRELVESARRLGLDAVECSASEMDFTSEFDVVFSNGALHWMKDADGVIGRVAKALRPQGRFVAAMSGHNSMKPIIDVLVDELNRRGYDGRAANPWYFPTAEEYAARLAAAGFSIEYIALSPQMEPLPGDGTVWASALGRCFTPVLPQDQREDYLGSVRERIERLQEMEDQLTVGAFPLRFKARLAA